MYIKSTTILWYLLEHTKMGCFEKYYVLVSKLQTCNLIIFLKNPSFLETGLLTKVGFLCNLLMGKGPK